MSHSEIRASVIVPTFNRCDRLRKFFDALWTEVETRESDIEILVVDNDSTDGTWRFLIEEQARAAGCILRSLRESRRGKASALNKGLVEARGRIFMVLDDDVVVAPGWLTGHLECHLGGDFDAVQGRVLPGVDHEGKEADLRAIQDYNIPMVDYGDRICEIRGLIGTNISFKREVYQRVGLFDARLGPGASGFSEDTEYSLRIRQAGFKIGYTPFAVVFHELDSARYGKKYNLMTKYRKGISRSVYRRDSLLLKVLPHLFVNCALYGFFRLVRNSRRSDKTEGRLMRDLGYVLGRLRGRGKRSF
jgi:GT2 family glycosyltransferase